MLPSQPDDGRTRGEKVKDALSHPVGFIRELTGGSDLFPLMILFGLALFEVIDRSTMQVFTPNIRDDFGLNDASVLAIVSVASVFGLGLTVPIALLADRSNRVRLLFAGTIVFAVFSIGTGMIPTVWIMLLAMRMGAGVGQATVFPTHNSLLADYYDIPYRPAVYSIHRSAEVLGLTFGPMVVGRLGEASSWRVPFIIFAIPCVLVAFVGMRLREPSRGHFERDAMGADALSVEVQEAPPSMEEAWRMVWRIGSLRRIFYAMPFLAVALVGFGYLANLLYAEEFGLTASERGFFEGIAEPAALVGLAVSAVAGTQLLRRGPSFVIRFVAVIAVFASAMAAGFALAPTVWLTVLFRIGISISLAAVMPSVFAALSLAIPARARASGFSMAVIFVIPGMLVLPVAGWISDSWGIRWGMLMMTPVFVLAGFIVSSAHKHIDNDIRNVWTATAARSELLAERRQGTIKQLLVRGLDVSYGDVQILFNVDFEVDQGSIIALLGTNGAGKSTLLKAITGVVQPSNGAVIFDGRDVTDAPPHEIAALGIAMVPGGQGVFPTLTVRENLKVASWLEKDRSRGRQRLAAVQEMFPILTERMDDAAANLSGGQQQMLGLSMAFLSEPKMLVIDELSLGLAPVVVEQLLAIVRAIRDQGTTIILVEQSVNVALTLAETAYFMEKGEIRFHGPTKELLERPDVLRSVFLEGASKGMSVAARADAVPAQEVAGPDDQAANLPSTGGAIGRGNVGSDAGGHDRGGSGPAGAGSPLDAFLAPAAPRVTEPERADQPAPAPADLGPVSTAEPDGRSPTSVRASMLPDGMAEGLSVHGLSVRFGGIRAVDNVTMSVGQGEIVGIIGPNGAGKTTLFDLISGFTSADAGRVVLAGTDISHLAPDARARRGLGRSFQDARLFPALTVEETIAVALERWVDVKDPLNAALRLPAQQDSEHEVRKRVNGLIELMGIESFRSKFVRELSTGSRRVVDIVCVLAHHPSVVLLDEPSSGIAQKEAEALSPLLLRIRDNLGASLIVIEHDMPLISSVSDRLVALDQGHVVAVGEPDVVLSHPEVVQSYLGNTKEVIERSGAAT